MLLLMLRVKFVRAVREHRSTTPQNGNVDVANDDEDATSCGQSTPGGSRQCGVVAVATVAMQPPAYDVVVAVSYTHLTLPTIYSV